MTDRIRIAIFTLFSILISCITSCQYSYDFDLCGTVVCAADNTPVADALVQVLPYEEAFLEDIESLSSFGKSTAEQTDADGYYKVYFKGYSGGCRQSVGPWWYFDSLYVGVIKPGYEPVIVGISTDEIMPQLLGECYPMPTISITLESAGKP